ncbi:MAG: formylglycine-generating enzyme family protein [Pyrinomonadaceae bacterium]
MTRQHAERAIGLLSYSRMDDEDNDLLITKLSLEIERKIRSQSGLKWRIRQDKDYLRIGEGWRKVHDFAEPAFLFAIITPSYVGNDSCMEEWEKFEEYEKEFGGGIKLILPIYLIELRPNVCERGKKVLDRFQTNPPRRFFKAFEQGSLDGLNPEIKRLALDVVSLSEEFSPPWQEIRQKHHVGKTGNSEISLIKPEVRSVEGKFLQLRNDEPDTVPVPIVDKPVEIGDRHPERNADVIGTPVPVRKVRITGSFEMGIVPVTFAQWDFVAKQVHMEPTLQTGLRRLFRLLGYPYHSIKQVFPDRHDDEGFGRDTRPAIHVNWFGAQAYCVALSQITGNYYRLPTEAEWEYCCRARPTTSTTNFSRGDSPDDRSLEKFVNFDRRYNATTSLDWPSYENAFRLRHMHGQVWEWVEDCYTSRFADLPPDGGPYLGMDRILRMHEYPRVVRGGSWTSKVDKIRSASRSKHLPEHHHHNVGFRIVKDTTT